MSRVVVMSRNPTLSWGLAAGDRDLIEVRPHQVDHWLDHQIDDAVDLVVIDLDDPVRSASVVMSMRASAQMAPALLVTGSDPAWSQSLVNDLPGAEVLPLPVTTDSLHSAVDRMLATGHVAIEPASNVGTEPASATPELPQTEHSAEQPAPLAVAATIEADPDLVAPVEPTSAEPAGPTERVPGLRRSSRTSATVRDAVVGAHLLGQLEQLTRVGQQGTSSPPPQREPTTPEVAVPSWSPPITDRPARVMDSANALARSLMLRVDELYTVEETAEVIVADALASAGGDSAALLLPDGRRWRVAAGTGLGAMERRFELDEGSWVVANVARGSKVVLVEDTDVARQPFQTAPLASRRHLIAAPVALVEGILLVARDADPSFDESVVGPLAALADEAGLLLAAALDIRELARKLQPFSDLDR